MHYMRTGIRPLAVSGARSVLTLVNFPGTWGAGHEAAFECAPRSRIPNHSCCELAKEIHEVPCRDGSGSFFFSTSSSVVFFLSFLIVYAVVILLLFSCRFLFSLCGYTHSA